MKRTAGSLALVGMLSLGACHSGSAAERPSAPATPIGVRFQEIAARVGLNERQSIRRIGRDCLLNPDRLRTAFPSLAAAQITGASGDQCLPERMAGGAAAADFNGDGWVDLYVTSLDGPGHLYENRRGRFVDVTNRAGLGQITEPGNGAAWGDIDNDGRPDLVVTTLAGTRNFLLHNRDGRHFDESAVARGVAVINTRVHTGFTPTFGDYDNDGWIDLFVTEWSSAEWTANSGKSDQRLLRNLGAAGRPGEFDDVTDRVGVATELPTLPVLGFGARLVDLDADGRSDLVLASDFRTSRLFWNDGDRFTDGTKIAGVGTDENGMGLTVADYNGDGRPDLFVTSIFGTTPPCEGGYCGYAISGNRLYRNDGDRHFTDVTDLEGVRDGGWGWGAAFADFANAGQPDLVMTSGVDFPFAPSTRRYRNGGMRLWRADPKGGFRDEARAAGLTRRGPGKGLLVFDFDRDGRIDVLVVRDGRTPALYRNTTPKAERHWLGVRVVGTQSNHDGIGAVVTVATPGDRPQVQSVGSVTGFLAQSELVTHFGLGRAERATVEVSWPGSTGIVRRTLRNLDRVITITQPG